MNSSIKNASKTDSYTPEFQSLVKLVETSLTQAATDAQELAKKTNTTLVVQNENGIYSSHT